MTQTPSVDELANARKDLVQRRFGFLVFIIGGTLVIALLTPFAAESVIVGFAIFYAVGAIVTGWRLQRFPCPRCGKAFFENERRHNVLAAACLNCGLPVKPGSR